MLLIRDSLCILSHMAIAKFTPEQRKELMEYLEIHKMSEGKSLCEGVSGEMAQVISGIEESEIKSQTSSPLPPNQGRWVSAIASWRHPVLHSNSHYVWCLKAGCTDRLLDTSTRLVQSPSMVRLQVSPKCLHIKLSPFQSHMMPQDFIRAQKHSKEIT